MYHHTPPPASPSPSSTGRSRPGHAPARLRRRTGRVLLTGAAVLVALVASTAAALTARASVPATPAGWNLVWSDDFNGGSGTGVSGANWTYDTGTSYPGGAPNWGTGEVETMTTSTTNVYQDGGGHLTIKPVRDSAGNWTSGRIETQRTDFAAPAGGKLRVEASLQQPNISGAAAAGYWPAFWMLGAAARGVGATNWPSIGELDLMEDINGLSSEFATLHCGTPSGGPCNETTGLGSGQRACSGCQTGYHTYAMEYDRSVSPEQIRWYLDGANFFTLNSTVVDATTWNNALHHGFFIILNVAMGGAFPAAFGGGPTSATQSGAAMDVDYVAVYTSGGTTASPTAAASSPAASPSPTTAPSPTIAPSPTSAGGTVDAYSPIQAESYNAQSGTQTEATSDTGGGSDLTSLANGDWLQFNNVNFGSTPATQFYGRVASGASGGISGLVEVRLDSLSSTPIGSFAIANTGGWQNWRTVPANIAAVTGTHTVYITFTSGQPADFVNVNWLSVGH